MRVPSIRAEARISGGLHKRRKATRGRLGRPDFSIAGGVRGTPSAPYRLRRSRRAKISICIAALNEDDARERIRVERPVT